MNDIFTTLGVAKTFADNSNSLSNPEKAPNWSSRYSPVLESMLNVVWLIPAAGAIIQTKKPKTSDWLTLAGNLSFDLGGIITPGSESAIVKSPQANVAFFAAMEVLTASYGLLSMGNGIALGKRD